MKKRIRVLLFGASGRMGGQIVSAAQADNRIFLQHKISSKNIHFLRSALRESDVVVDFSSPAGAMVCAAAAAECGVAMLIGTTGFSVSQIKKFKNYSKKTAILLAPNCSPGMNLLYQLSRTAAGALSRYDAAVSESHHSRKKDIPSGSAKRLAQAVKDGRKKGSRVPIVSFRMGDIIGDHTVTFAGKDERMELTHRAQSRSVFARGALDAAVWLHRKKRGCFTMQDYLRL